MLRPTKREENKLYRQGISFIAGVDEAGRGAWAGPLVAAAVILPRDFKLRGINDSKKLSPTRRELMYNLILKQAVAYYAYRISHKSIDKKGVGKANLLAISRSVRCLAIKPEAVLIDSFEVNWPGIASISIKKGDTKVISIAAASIIAKVTRDRIMTQYHKRYPNYNFVQHKGYGTEQHHKKILQHGPCPLHRCSFAPIRDILK
jgi:ribonuclease HII